MSFQKYVLYERIQEKTSSFQASPLVFESLSTNEIAGKSSSMPAQRKIRQVGSLLDELKSRSKLFSIQYGFLEKTISGKIEDKKMDFTPTAISLWLSPFLSRRSSKKHWIVDNSGLPTFEPRSLKQWIRRGVPSCDRKTLWRFLIHKQILKNDCSIHTEHDYYSYTRRTDVLDEKTKYQIDIDVCRCLTNNICYQSDTKKRQLADILSVFSLLNPRISYCQSFSRVAAFALLVLPEFEAFLAFEQIICHIMPQDYYIAPMASVQSDMFALKNLIIDKLPQLAKHFAKLDIEPQFFALSWFHSLFVAIFPVDIVLLMWDNFFNEGPKILFRMSLAVLWSKQKQLLEFKEATDLLCFLSKLDTETFDVSQIRRLAFKDVNPISEETINLYRIQYFQQMASKAE